MSESAREYIRNQMVQAALEAAERLDVDFTGSVAFHFDEGRFQRYNVTGTYRLNGDRSVPKLDFRSTGTGG